MSAHSRSLQHTLNELRGYQKKHDEWLNLQQKLLLEQATPEMKLESRLEYEEQKIRESADGRGRFYGASLKQYLNVHLVNLYYFLIIASCFFFAFNKIFFSF